MELKKLMEHISIIPDYSQAWKVEHKLSDILLLTICAVISGVEGWEDIEDFGETHLDFLKQYGSLFRILCKCLFSEVTVQAVTELDNKAAHCHSPV
ncbi:transposase family protein, partial [Escherichia coli]